MGVAYDEGIGGLTPSKERANEWWTKAAANGCAEAQACLGVNYLHGEGVKRDAARGIKLMQQAADQGQPDALSNLSGVFFFGTGTPQSLVKARDCVKRAILIGSVMAKGAGPLCARTIHEDPMDQIKLEGAWCEWKQTSLERPAVSPKATSERKHALCLPVTRF